MPKGVHLDQKPLDSTQKSRADHVTIIPVFTLN